MMASRSQTLLRKPGSACAARSSGWRSSVKAVQPHWRNDGVFAAPSSRSVDPQQLQQAVDLRHQRCTLRRIAKALQAPLATVGRVMNALGLGQLRNLASWSRGSPAAGFSRPMAPPTAQGTDTKPDRQEI